MHWLIHLTYVNRAEVKRISVLQVVDAWAVVHQGLL